MFRNYLKIAWRNLDRHKAYTAINVVGLALGMTCCILIFLFVRTSLQYDTHHRNADNIYRILSKSNVKESGQMMTGTPSPVVGAAREFPEVEQAARMIVLPHTLVEAGNKKFYEDNYFLADSSILQVLTLPLKYGDPETALDAPDAMLISEAAAAKYFGNENPLGKVLTISKDDHFRVTGVIAAAETPMHLKADFIGSFSVARKYFGKRLQSWGWNQFYNYLLLKPGTDAQAFAQKLNQHYAAEVEKRGGNEGMAHKLSLQPVREIYLHSANFEYDQANRGNITYVYAFGIVALFILAIASLNFMNLATAQSLKRAKEVGIRKVIGAYRTQLTFQFLGESIMLTVGSFLLALLLVEVSLPYFSQLAGEDLSISYPQDLWLVLALLAASIPVGLLAGVYPAFFVSAFLPIDVLKSSTTSKGYKLSTLRKGLVVTQFVISIALIAATAVVYQQLNYINQKNLGLNKEQTLVVRMETDQMQQDYQRFKAELEQNPQVLSVAGSYGVPGGHQVGDAIQLDGQPLETPVSMIVADFDYMPSLKMQMAAGRAFDRKYPTDKDQAFVVNETAARTLGFATAEEAIGQKVSWKKWTEKREPKNGRIIGVVKDFHFKSLHQKIEPMVLHVEPEVVWWLSIRISPEQMPATLAFIEQKWNAHGPGYPFDYHFMDELFGNMYAKEQKMSQVFTLFSSLAIAIACMGLLGLVAFAAEQRTKEIGIRKTLGATVMQILMLLSKDFAKLVLVAVLIATPLAWYGMRAWLNDYAYRIDLSWWVFALAGLGALAIAMLTVWFRALRVANINPVKALRTE